MEWVWFAFEIGLALGAFVVGIYAALFAVVGVITVLMGIAAAAVIAVEYAVDWWRS